MSFDRTSTPRKCQSCKNRIFVFMHTRHKRLKGLQMTGFHFVEPGVKLFSRALTYHVQKFVYQLIGDFQLWACLPQLSQGLLLFWLEILLLTEKEPGGLCR